MLTPNPKVRVDGLLIEALPGELLIYDRTSHRAHCLNASAAAVFQSADGTRTIAEITQAVATQLGGAFDDDLTWTALEELDENGLLEAPLPPRARGLTRRRLLAVGAAIPLVPVVLAITAPTPAFAASGPGGSTGATGPGGSTGFPGPTGPGGSTAG